MMVIELITMAMITLMRTLTTATEAKTPIFLAQDVRSKSRDYLRAISPLDVLL